MFREEPLIWEFSLLCSCAGLMSWSQCVGAVHFLKFWHLLKSSYIFSMRLNANSGFVSVFQLCIPICSGGFGWLPHPHWSEPPVPAWEPAPIPALALSRIANVPRGCPNNMTTPAVSEGEMKICLHHVSA